MNYFTFIYNWKKVVLRNPDEITNKDVKKLLRKHAFYEEVNTLSKILRPIKTAITMVEGE